MVTTSWPLKHGPPRVSGPAGPVLPLGGHCENPSGPEFTEMLNFSNSGRGSASGSITCSALTPQHEGHGLFHSTLNAGHARGAATNRRSGQRGGGCGGLVPAMPPH